jgi:hypothetical protein
MADSTDGPYESIPRRSDDVSPRRQLTEFFRTAAIIYTVLAAANLFLQVIRHIVDNGHPFDLIPLVTSNLYGVVVGVFFVCIAELFLRGGDQTDEDEAEE